MGIAVENIGIIILAGGKSRRMGRDKAFLPFRGKLFIEHILEAAAGLSEDIRIIANVEGYERFAYPIHRDLIADKGPLGGIYTGLTKSKKDWNLVLSCDIPLIKTELLRYLLEQSHLDVLLNMASIGEHSQPLIALYHQNGRAAIKKLLERDKLRLRKLPDHLPTQIVQLPPSFAPYIQNVNRPEELGNLKDKL